MKKNLLFFIFLFVANFGAKSQIVSIRPNHALQGQNLNTTITLASGVMQNSTPPSNSSGIYLEQGATRIYTTFGYQPQNRFYYFYNVGTSTFIWYDSTQASFPIPSNAPTGYYDVVLVSYVLPLLTPDTNRLVNGFYIETPTGTLSGTVYFDINQNGIRDVNDPTLPNQRVQFAPTLDIAFTNSLGEFSYFVDTGTYTTDYIGTYVQTSAPLTYTSSIPPSATGLDFGVYSAAVSFNHSIFMNRLRFRCNTTNNTILNVSNYGYTPSQEIVSLVVSPNLTFVSSTIPPDYINGDTLTWLIPLLLPSTNVNVGGVLTFTAPGAGQIVSFHLIDSIFDLGGTFIDVKNDDFSYEVRCSYDPNDKLASPLGVLAQNYTPINSELTYLVNFQNTGNDFAYDVFIFDTLDADLDISTFEVIGSSHELNTQISTSGAIRFNFYNIMLPDSGLNEPGSHGFVLYKVSPNAGLPDPTEITNTSYIVFDFNYPIITNTTLNTMTALQYPQSAFTTADVSICETNCILFNNLSTSGSTYQWNFAGGAPSSSSSASPGAICYSAAGSYDVTLITTNALGSDTLTQIAYINVATSPGVFTVIQVADSLVAPQGFDGYQWYFNNILIPGATSYYYVATQNGDYGIVVSNINGCQSGVNIPNFSIGVEDIFSSEGIEIYPNPTSGSFEVTFKSTIATEVSLSLYDKLGQLVYQEQIQAISGSNRISINSELSTGVYTLKIATEKGIGAKRLMINK